MVVTPLALAKGGYWPTAWGWTAFALLWVSILALLLSDRPRLGPLGLAMLIPLVALFGWTLLSHVWSSATRSPLESQRTLVYVASLCAVLFVVRRSAARALLAGVWAAIALVSAFGLVTKLFPERYGLDPDLGGYRLAEPLGYWNALGILAALGALLGLGLVTHARTRLLRGLAGASLPVLLVTLYFTFSRGAWIALGVGLAAVLAFERKRLRVITTSLALLPFSVFAIWICAQPDALNQEFVALTEASRQGHRIAPVVAALALASGVAAVLVGELRRHVEIPRGLQFAYVVSLAAVSLLAVGIGIARFGNPVEYPERISDALDAPVPRDVGARNRDAREAFLEVSSSRQWRTEHWRVAWAAFKERPLVGSGGGTYERAWNLRRTFPGKVRDAFSLYLETLAELGVIGFGFLVAFLAVPLVAAIKARRHRLVPAALGAYVAFLFHAGIDWDWEMPVVTVAALFCGTAIVLWAREDAAPPLSARVRLPLITVLVTLAGFSFVGLIGNHALAASQEAREDGNLEEAESQARKAMSWMFWSEEPWLEVARVQRDRGDVAAARRTLEKTIAKDPSNWRPWYVLARVSTGEERRRALARATALNPLSLQIADFRSGLAEIARLRKELAEARLRAKQLQTELRIARLRGDLPQQAGLQGQLSRQRLQVQLLERRLRAKVAEGA